MPFVAVAGLGAIADAIVAIVILLAIVAIAYLVEKFGGYIPLIGGWLAAQAVRFLQVAQSATMTIYLNMLWAAQQTVNMFISFIIYPLSKLTDLSHSIVNAFYWVKNVAIPGAIATANAYAYWVWTNLGGYVRALVATAEANALWYYHDAIAFVRAEIAATDAEISWVYDNLGAYIRALVGTALSTALAGIAAVDHRVTALVNATVAAIIDTRTWVQGLLGTAVAGLEADIATVEQRIQALAEQYAQAALKDALAITDVTATLALTQVWPGLITDVDGLLDAIPQELKDIRDEIASIPRAIPGSLLDALAALGMLAIPFLRFLRDCGVPMCRDLHGLSDLFNGLNSAVTDVALVGFFTLCVTDPQAAATAIVDVIGPVADVATRATEDLIGV